MKGPAKIGDLHENDRKKAEEDTKCVVSTEGLNQYIAENLEDTVSKL